MSGVGFFFRIVVLDISLHIEIITKSVLHTFCSRVYLCADYFSFLEFGNITKRDLLHTNLGRFGIYYIRRCLHSYREVWGRFLRRESWLARRSSQKG